MTRLFTWPQIERREVPHLSAFSAVVHEIRDVLSACRTVDAAQIIGSAVKLENCSVLSDVDGVVIYREGPVAEKAFRHLEWYASVRFVPLQLIYIHRTKARTPDHTIEASFLDHLRRHPGGSIKGAVWEKLYKPELELAADVRSYLRKKSSKLQEFEFKQLVLPENELVYRLGKALSFPVYAMRKVLQVCGYDFPDGDGKRAVIDATNNWSETHEHTKLLRAFYHMEQQYASEIERGTITKKLHADLHGEILNNLPTVIYLADTCLEFLRTRPDLIKA